MASNTHYVIKDATAQMPGTCWGTYRRIAVLEVEEGARPKMISERARGVVRVVRTWEKLNVGSTDRCAYMRAWREAEQLAASLNGTT